MITEIKAGNKLRYPTIKDGHAGDHRSDLEKPGICKPGEDPGHTLSRETKCPGPCSDILNFYNGLSLVFAHINTHDLSKANGTRGFYIWKIISFIAFYT